MFYMPRLFIYDVEANEKTEPARSILHNQFAIMMKRLWYGITWPSAILTVLFGTWMGLLYNGLPDWLIVKLCFVCGLYAYHFTLHKIFSMQQKGIYKFSSNQLRIWNEVATIFLVAIVIVVSVKQALSALWGIAGLIAFVLLLFSAIKIYKIIRKAS